MNREVRNIISLLLILITVLTCVTTVFAEQPDLNESINEEQSTESVEQEATTEEGTTQEPETEQPTQPDSTNPIDDEVVGIIYLCSRWSSITTTGHLWVYIENTSDEPITVGLLEVAPGEGVSLATFGFTRSDGFGIYYNMETYRNDKYCDESCISISDELTAQELEKVTKKLLNSNQWNPIVNCVFFACSIWNAAGDKYIMPFTYPPITRLIIKLSGGTETCMMNYQPPENTFKQRGMGKNSYLDPLSQKSLDA